MTKIRVGSASDRAMILAFWEQTDTIPGGLDDGLALDHLASSTGRIFLAMEADELIGTVVAGDDGWRGGIYRLMVHPSHRRSGVGSALVRSAEEFLVDKGVARVAGVVMADDANARRFWAAQHYVPRAGTERWGHNLQDDQ